MMSPLLLTLALKSTAVLILGGGAAWLLRLSPASLRHGVWAATFTVLLALPVLAAVGPVWRVAMLPSPSADELQSRPAATWLRGEAAPRPRAHRAVPHDGASAAPHRSAGAHTSSAGVIVAAARGMSLPAWLACLWAIGAVVVASVWLRAFALARRLVRESYTSAAPEWAARGARASSQSGLKAPVRLLWSDALSIPIAWGFGRTAVVLPPQSERWDADRSEAVLLHEMAHLRRRDAWTQLVAQAALAVHWPNPLAWMAYRRFLDAREQACDDAVLRVGASATDYASHLVAVAREISASRLGASRLSASRLSASRLTQAAVASMAGRGELETRVRSVLDGHRRRGVLHRRTLGAVLVLSVGVGVPLAAFHPVEASGNRVVPGAAPLAPRSPSLGVAPTSAVRSSGGEVTLQNVVPGPARADSTGDALPTSLPDPSPGHSDPAAGLLTSSSRPPSRTGVEQANRVAGHPVAGLRIAGPPSRDLSQFGGDAVEAAIHRVQVAHLDIQTMNIKVGDAARGLGAAQDTESRDAAQATYDASLRALSAALVALEDTQKGLSEALEVNAGQ